MLGGSALAPARAGGGGFAGGAATAGEIGRKEGGGGDNPKLLGMTGEKGDRERG